MSAWGNPLSNPIEKGSGNNPNQTKPNTDQTNGGARGIAQGRIEAQVPRSIARVTERKPMREIYAKELAWAAEYLPDEYGPFVCLAIESVKRQGLKPSTQTVLAQLRATRRDSVACLERAKRYGVVAKDG